MHIILGGDFNVRFGTGDARELKLCTTLRMYGLRPLVDFPTRRVNCLDNIFTNVDPGHISVKPVDLSLSDHLGLDVLLNSRVHERYSRPNRIIRPITCRGRFLLFSMLSDVNWDFVRSDIDCDNRFSMFCNTVLYYYNIAFPPTKMSSNRRSKINLSWFTPHLAKMRETLHFLYDNCQVAKSASSRQLLAKFRSNYNVAIKHAKTAASDQFIRNHINNAKALWSLVNVKSPNSCTTQISPEIFSAFFSSTADELLNRLPPPNLDPINIANNMHDERKRNVFAFKLVSPVEVRDVVAGLRSSGSKDIYGLTTSLLKSIIDTVVSPLTKLINDSISEGVFPSCLKMAIVVPVHKKGDINDVNNFRPISLLPIFSKVFEKVLMKQVACYFEANGLFSEHQYGFRRGLSTTNAILSLVQKITRSFEDGLFYGASFLDLSKAFDCVSHDILLQKLAVYGFDFASLQLISSYLDNRKQRVLVDGKVSNDSTVHHGVPQGSILGPILFLVYINDFSKYLNEADTVLFADDTTLGVSSFESVRANESRLVHLRDAQEWFQGNRLTLNTDKSVHMTFSLRATTPQSFGVTEHCKFLGVYISSSLTWNRHGSYVSDKIAKNIYLLRNLSNCLTRSNLKPIYFALIHSHLDYALLVWGHSTALVSLFALQRRAVRVISGIDYRSCCRSSFVGLKILTLPSLYIYRCLEYFLGHSSEYHSLGSYHQYDTRSGLISLNALRLTRSRNAVNYFCIKFYNVLPVEFRGLPCNVLKSRIRVYLIEKCFYSFEEYLSNNFDDLIASM